MASDHVIMRLREALAEAIVLINLSMYTDYACYYKKGESVLYVRMSKAPYGLLKSALDFYLKLRGNLESVGFEVNLYDPCDTGARKINR